jgi:hypothetical protein
LELVYRAPPADGLRGDGVPAWYFSWRPTNSSKMPTDFPGFSGIEVKDGGPRATSR